MNDSALWDDYGYHHDDLDEPKSLVPVSFSGADTAPDGSRGQAPPGDDTPTAGG